MEGLFRGTADGCVVYLTGVGFSADRHDRCAGHEHEAGRVWRRLRLDEHVATLLTGCGPCRIR